MRSGGRRLAKYLITILKKDIMNNKVYVISLIILLMIPSVIGVESKNLNV